MIKLILLFLMTGMALVVAVTVIVGVAWMAVAIPVMIATGAGYGLVALNRRWARPKNVPNVPTRIDVSLNADKKM